MKYTIIVIILFVGALYSCSPKIVPSAPVNGIVQETLSIAAAEGKSLYEHNCAKCHTLYDPTKFTAEEWTPILQRMQKKAHIDDAERDKIYAYIKLK